MTIICEATLILKEDDGVFFPEIDGALPRGLGYTIEQWVCSSQDVVQDFQQRRVEADKDDFEYHDAAEHGRQPR